MSIIIQVVKSMSTWKKVEMSSNYGKRKVQATYFLIEDSAAYRLIDQTVQSICIVAIDRSLKIL